MISTFLAGLQAIFGWLLEASWQASILAVLVLALQWTTRGRLNPRWHHALWLLVVARLVLPALPESALSLFRFVPSPPPIVTQTMTEPIFAASPAPSPATSISSVHGPSAPYPFSVFTALALVWLTGALGILTLTWLVNHRFFRHVAAAPKVAQPNLLA